MVVMNIGENVAPIIIVKKIKKASHAHHGGAWKVAYADFVTAMMAFFLLMWLLNATTEDQKRGIADYFTPATVSKSKSGAGGLMGGLAVSSPGAKTSKTSVPSASVRLRPTSGASDAEAEMDTGAIGGDGTADVSNEMLNKAMQKREEEAFEKAEKELKQAMQRLPQLKALEKHLLVDRTEEGLRIQIVDAKNRPMFAVGSATMLGHTTLLIAQVAKVINKLPNKIAVSGHTDASPFRGKRRGYGNWELSTGRALSSRRALVENGVSMSRIVRVTGKAASDPLLPDKPKSARNRRIAIVLLRGARIPAAAQAAKPEFKRDWSGQRLR